MDKIKLVTLITVLAMASSGLVSCGPGNGKDSSQAEKKDTSSAAESTADSDAQPAGDTTLLSNEELARSGEVRDISAMELVAEMKTGWNLGNSLDATGAAGNASEVNWGNPKTTKEMIDAVYNKGFDVIRIPVTWGGHVGDGPDYKIDEDWLARVQEVVNYAYDDGAYVIINSHHEEDWRIPDNEHIDAVDEKTAAIWKQVAERFKDYGDHLIFEGLNEPRVKGSPEEWNGGTEEGRRCVERLNQTFLDTVRATGGNNEKRLLLMTTYASSCGLNVIQDTAIPEDDHIGFSIHAYTPYAFTYNANADWELFEWDNSRDGELITLMSNLKENYLDKDIPVIITEYGAVCKNNNDEERAKWVSAYIEYAEMLGGIPCVWWDNGYYSSGNELFGIFDRNTCTWFTDTVTDAIIANAK
ncbi:glycoside hydrolase family 5 protein [Ruminococcus albus]|uniref:Endoglucanase n=1 Tax=Ruminococcus albus TaxID=1264 RepID=A0A1I1KHA3_RUMAL|nr:glycoside hydrolase family 5 protein [Ruminococcus albus]SFC60199.1 endoglucanase [Ruminococcus albus]